MKKYRLCEVHQNKSVYYTFVADPRIIVKLLKQYEAGAVQDCQRPWEENRVKEIALYVSTGLIPNAPILNIKTKLKIEKDDEGLFLSLPETNAEFEDYKDTLEAIDGQHRIRAFMDEYCCLDTTTKYELVFTLFDKLSKDEKKKTFMTTNEKQKTVSPNLLRLYRRELSLITGDKADIFDLTSMLNTEDFSPLKDRIMMGADKIKKGYQESQISKILELYGSYKALKTVTGGDITLEAKIISNYLNAWESHYGESFHNPGKSTLTKISGIRFVLVMLPKMLSILSDIKKQSARKEAFVPLIQGLIDANDGLDAFNPTEEEKQTVSAKFKSESGTVEFANDMAEKLVIYERKQSESGFCLTEGL